MEHLKNLFDLTKLPAKFFFLFAVLTGCILFVDSLLLKKIYLDNLIVSHGWIVGLIFILSSGLVIINFALWLFKYFQKQLRIYGVKNKFRQRLKNLDFHEKAVLREFLIINQSSINMPIDDPVVSGLIAKNILIINKPFATGSGFMMSNFYTSISRSEYADKYLKLPDLDLNLNFKKKDFLKTKQNRPTWTK